MNLQKKKRVRLQGKAVERLNEQIHERDNYTCIVPNCGRFVPIDEKWHHEKGGEVKSDTPETGVLLCWNHHQERHFGKDSQAVKTVCVDYLSSLYPEQWGGAGSEK